MTKITAKTCDEISTFEPGVGELFELHPQGGTKPAICLALISNIYGARSDPEPNNSREGGGLALTLVLGKDKFNHSFPSNAKTHLRFAKKDDVIRPYSGLIELNSCEERPLS